MQSSNLVLIANILFYSFTAFMSKKVDEVLDLEVESANYHRCENVQTIQGQK